MTGNKHSGNKKAPRVGDTEQVGRTTMRFTGLDTHGAENWEGIAKKPKSKKVKMKPKTNYKSTGSKKGKVRKRKSLM